MTMVSMSLWRTTLSLEVVADIRPEVLERALAGQVAAVDAAASRFRPDSQVRALQARPGTWVPVGPLLLELLTVACRVAEATQGLVHPGLGAQAAAAGYDSWAGLDPEPPLDTTPPVVPWQEIEIDPDGAARVPPGMVLDLGATAKAWLADRLATALHEPEGAAVVANMGGDLRCISADRPWTVRLDPELPGVVAPVLSVRDAGVATSGLSRRRWTGGHHIIDPRSGAPADTPWWTASVVAADAVGANAAATSAIVAGATAPQWLAERGHAAMLVDRAGATTSVGRLPLLRSAA